MTDNLRSLAEGSPARLVEIIRSGHLPAADLTCAAEACGNLADHAMATALLVDLASHPHAMVREGAVYGLVALPPSDAVRTCLAQLAANDTSPAVQQAAGDALSE